MAEMENFSNGRSLLKVDVDKAEDVSSDNGISAMPTFILFKKEAKVEFLNIHRVSVI